VRRLALLFAAVALFAADLDFAAWWPQFQNAVAKHDAKFAVQGASFPMHWENGKIRDIKTEADLAKRFEFYFTPEIRKAIVNEKPERLPSGTYIITWKARGNEYSLYFKPAGGSFALDGLSEGPL
jgi:hypothetical protein